MTTHKRVYPEVSSCQSRRFAYAAKWSGSSRRGWSGTHAAGRSMSNTQRWTGPRDSTLPVHSNRRLPSASAIRSGVAGAPGRNTCGRSAPLTESPVNPQRLSLASLRTAAQNDR